MDNINPNKLLPEIQANILRNHGRKHCCCLFLFFNKEANPDYLREKISQFAKGENPDKIKITTAHEQRENSVEYKKAKAKDKPFNGMSVLSFYLTAEGYKSLGINQRPDDFSFLKGMTYIHNQKFLCDNHEDWEDWYKDEKNKIHAMILAADNNPDILKDVVSRIKSHFDNLVEIKYENGSRLFDKKPDGSDDENKPVEVFGFQDGSSQPPFWTPDPKNKFKKNLRTKNLRLILTPDSMGLGSYLVFRKIQQFKKDFENQVEKIAIGLFGNEPPTKDDMEKVRALIIGRYRNGDLLMNKGSKPMRVSDKKLFKQFNQYETGGQGLGFNHDANGQVCPFHSHIRKVNPRDPNLLIRKNVFYSGTTDKKVELRIIRLGIPYRDSPENEGLLFMSFQASILRQFVPMHKMWINRGSFPNPNTGIDPLIGSSGISEKSRTTDSNHLFGWRWRDKYFQHPFKKPIKVLGGEFFFAPSIPFLQNIDKI